MYWLLNSSIGRKLIMSISGIFLVLFLLFHMTMNLTLVFSTNTYDWICEILGANWYAIAATLALSGGFVVHIAYGTLLTLRNQKARGASKYAFANHTRIEWASKNMYILGLIILLGLVVHLWNFWYKMQYAELLHLNNVASNGSNLVIGLFTDNPEYGLIYLLWLTCIWFHLTHGIWSAFQTLGLSNKKWYPRLKHIANILATIIMIGFAAAPVYFSFLGLIK